MGRFISRDPIGYVDGMNLYGGYFVNRGVDPFGLITGASSIKVDEVVTQTIDGKTYRWPVKMNIDIDFSNCTMIVTVKIKTDLPAGKAKTDYEASVKQKIVERWNNKYKLCCNCLCVDGIPIVVNPEFVNTGEDQLVHVEPKIGGTDVNMTNWGPGSVLGGEIPIPHEFRHMIGATDEYGVRENGIDYGAAFQNTVNTHIMNNPEKSPAANNYSFIVDKINNAVSGANCRIVGKSTKCN